MDNLADLSLPVLVAIVFVLLVLIILLKGFRLPGDFFRREQRRSISVKDHDHRDERLVFTEEDVESEGRKRKRAELQCVRCRYLFFRSVSALSSKISALNRSDTDTTPN
jgi:hypothetical protein